MPFIGPRLLLAAAAVLLPATAPHPPPAAATPRIQIEAAREGEWTVRYRLGKPARQLAFARSPDASRGADWKAPDGFEIFATEAGEAVRRRDGRPFRSVSLRVPPVYRELPKDYAPFSPFGDGGILFHTGRFFACAEACAGSPSWSMRLTAPRDARILLRGKAARGSVRWTDSESGQNVYVGTAKPVATPDLVAVIDGALPGPIRAQLERELPRFMHYFAERLGAISEAPMLFASYDVAHPQGWGRQGGTLPGQVFTHFYGSIWPDRMKSDGLARELGWFFAHEAAHLYQRQLFGADVADAWVHEGGADAFAAIALRDAGDGNGAKAQIAAAGTRCRELLAGNSLREAIAAGRFDAAYACGLLVNLGIDARLRAAAPGSNGLFGLWRHYMAAVEKGAAPGETQFLASLAALGGEPMAAEAAAAVREKDWDRVRLAHNVW